MGKEGMKAIPAREQHMQSALLQREKLREQCAPRGQERGVALVLGVEWGTVARGEALYR